MRMFGTNIIYNTSHTNLPAVDRTHHSYTADVTRQSLTQCTGMYSYRVHTRTLDQRNKRRLLRIRTMCIVRLIGNTLTITRTICAQAARMMHHAFILRGNHKATRRSNVAHTPIKIDEFLPMAHNIVLMSLSPKNNYNDKYNLTIIKIETQFQQIHQKTRLITVITTLTSYQNYTVIFNQYSKTSCTEIFKINYSKYS